MKGVYALVIKLQKDSEINIGKLNLIKFRKGFYAYTGSALNSLEKRIERHLGCEKKIYWHIDYLLTLAEIVEVIYAETKIKKECEISGSLMENQFEFIKNFGSSDCKCRSHLFFSDDVFKLRKAAVNAFESNDLKYELRDNDIMINE